MRSSSVVHTDDTGERMSGISDGLRDLWKPLSSTPLIHAGHDSQVLRLGLVAFSGGDSFSAQPPRVTIWQSVLQLLHFNKQEGRLAVRLGQVHPYRPITPVSRVGALYDSLAIAYNWDKTYMLESCKNDY